MLVYLEVRSKLYNIFKIHHTPFWFILMVAYMQVSGFNWNTTCSSRGFNFFSQIRRQDASRIILKFARSAGDDTLWIHWKGSVLFYNLILRFVRFCQYKHTFDSSRFPWTQWICHVTTEENIWFHFNSSDLKVDIFKKDCWDLYSWHIILLIPAML